MLSANYILASLKDVMSAPFGEGPCMHEALFDDSFLEGTGVTTLDFAKAMIDEGYHPMTMYFPLVVHGAMLIEPTESELKESLDRFIHVLRDDGAGSEGRQDARASKARRVSRRAAASTKPLPRASRCCAGSRRTTCRRRRSSAVELASLLRPLPVLAVGLGIATIGAISTGYVLNFNRSGSRSILVKRSDRPVYYWFAVGLLALLTAICGYEAFALQ